MIARHVITAKPNKAAELLLLQADRSHFLLAHYVENIANTPTFPGASNGTFAPSICLWKFERIGFVQFSLPDAESCRRELCLNQRQAVRWVHSGDKHALRLRSDLPLMRIRRLQLKKSRVRKLLQPTLWPIAMKEEIALSLPYAPCRESGTRVLLVAALLKRLGDQVLRVSARRPILSPFVAPV